MKVVNIYSNQQLTCVQGMAGISLCQEDWMQNNEMFEKTNMKQMIVAENSDLQMKNKNNYETLECNT